MRTAKLFCIFIYILKYILEPWISWVNKLNRLCCIYQSIFFLHIHCTFTETMNVLLWHLVKWCNRASGWTTRVFFFTPLIMFRHFSLLVVPHPSSWKEALVVRLQETWKFSQRKLCNSIYFDARESGKTMQSLRHAVSCMLQPCFIDVHEAVWQDSIGTMRWTHFARTETCVSTQPWTWPLSK